MPRGWTWAGRASTRLRALGLGILVVLCLPGCGGGGGGDDSDPVICTNLAFDSVLFTPADGDVYFEEGTSTCTSLEVSVLVSNLSGIWTVGFDLTYPTTLLQYDSYSLGPLLQKGSPVSPLFYNVSPIAGGLQVLLSRFAPDPPVAAVGSEELLTLRFKRIGPGAAAIDFNTGGGSIVSESILDDGGLPRPAVFAPGHGGMVTVP
ncbi:MAG TPA: cohesin domain-containing protein [Candidatus Cryosericum sp.]|nr:cohesin domain-containing protein [Candidatus Cryosericum sp.]